MAEASPQPNNVSVKFKGRKAKKLPKHVHKAAKRGLISEAQMSKLRGEER